MSGRKRNNQSQPIAAEKEEIKYAEKQSRAGSVKSKISNDFDLLNQALQAAKIGIWSWDIASNEVQWSEHVGELLGLDNSSVFEGTFESYFAMVHPDDRQKIREAIDKTMNTGVEYLAVHRIVYDTGEIRWMEGAGNLLCDEAGKPAKLTGTLKDITEKKRIEQEREEWKTRHELIVASSDQVIYDYDILSGSITWSGNVLAVLGYTKGEVSDIKYWRQMVHPEDIEESTKKHFIASREATKYDNEYRFLAKNGEYIFIHDRGFFMYNSRHEAYRMLGTMSNISERKQTERNLVERERFTKSITESVPEIIYLYDLELQQNVYTNRNVGLTLGYSLEESTDDTGLAFVHPDDLARMPEIQLRYDNIRDDEIIEVEYRMKDKQGKWRWFVGRDRVFLRNEKGKVKQVIGVTLDITDIKKTEAALRESEQRFRMLLQASYGGIVLHEDEKIIDCNQGLADLFGYNSEELVGKNILTLIAPSWKELYREKITTHDHSSFDMQGLRKDGSKFFVEVQGKHFLFDGKQVEFTEFRDITDRKLVEARIMVQNTKLTTIADDLKRKNKQLEEFTQIVSHNLRSPVSNILTLINLYETETNVEEKNQYYNLLKTSSANIYSTLEELNDILKVRQSRNIEKEDLHFDKVFTRVKSMLNAKIIEISARVTGDFSATQVVSYPNIYLESIFLNLLSNSLKYHSPGQPPVINFKSYLNSNGNTILEVSDNGLGINLEKYGEQLFKLRKVFHRHPESRGVGLFLVKNQVETMGGEITVKSEENKGTTFFINFDKHS